MWEHSGRRILSRAFHSGAALSSETILLRDDSKVQVFWLHYHATIVSRSWLIASFITVSVPIW